MLGEYSIPEIVTPESLKSLRILGIMADHAACGNFRMNIPFKYLASSGYNTTIVPEGAGPDFFRGANIIVAQRAFHPMLCNELLRLQSQGVVLIYELDDNLHHVHRNSPAYDTYRPGGEPIKWVNKMLKAANGVTLSTVDLAADYLEFNQNTYVLENQIDFDLRDWQNRLPRTDDRLTVGWVGGAQHQEDMMFMSEWLPELMRRYPEIKFLICTNLDIAREFCFDLCRLDSSRVEIIHPRDFELYPPVISLIDIGLAPIIPSMFNKSKSNLKNLEYTAWGCATVASKFAPYVRWDAGGGRVLIADNTPTAWLDAVGSLIENKDLRNKMSKASQDYTCIHHDMKDHIMEWAVAWSDIYNRAKAGLVGIPGKSMQLSPGRNDPCPCGKVDDFGKRRKYKKCCFPAFS